MKIDTYGIWDNKNDVWATFIYTVYATTNKAEALAQLHNTRHSSSNSDSPNRFEMRIMPDSEDE